MFTWPKVGYHSVRIRLFRHIEQREKTEDNPKATFTNSKEYCLLA